MRYNLSEITDIIKDRRTIYPEQFSDRKVHKEQIELILNNAIWAPTHGNTQPWRFVVFQGESLLDLSETLGKGYMAITPVELQDTTKLAKIMSRPRLAPAVIAICMHPDENKRISYDDELAAIACAVQNMHLTCTAAGLGAFWSTPSAMKSNEIHSLLNLNEKDTCLGFFYIGYPAIEWPKGQRKPIEYLTEWRQ